MVQALLSSEMEPRARFRLQRGQHAGMEARILMVLPADRKPRIAFPHLRGNTAAGACDLSATDESVFYRKATLMFRIS
jgi:hypothetical protein